MQKDRIKQQPAGLGDSREAMIRLHNRVMSLWEKSISTELMREIHKAWNELKAAGRSNDIRKQQVAVAKIDSLMDELGESSKRWDEIYKLEEQLDRMRDRSLARHIAVGSLVNVELVVRLISIFVMAIKGVLQKTLTEIGHAEVAERINYQVEREFVSLFGRSPIDVPASEIKEIGRGVQTIRRSHTGKKKKPTRK